MSSTLLASEFLANLTDDTIVCLFNRCTDGISTNGPVKDGGFATAKIIIEEMAIRRKVADLDLARFAEQKEVFCKLMAFATSAIRSAHGRTPKTDRRQSDSRKSFLEELGWKAEYTSGPENITEMAQYVSGMDGPKAQDIARARTAQFAESTSRDDLVRAAEEIRLQQSAIETRTRLGRESLNAFVAECLKSDEPT